jgi:hypothetical protein
MIPMAGKAGTEITQRPSDRILFAWAAASAVLTGLVSLVIVAISVRIGSTPEVVMRDPAAEFGLPFYAGAVSYLGVALMLATAAVLAFASSLARDHRMIFICVSALSAILAFDDLFLLHEVVGPYILGIHELVFLSAYALAGIWMMSWIIRNMGPGAAGGLLVAGGCLAMSILVDQTVPYSSTSVVIEDLLKLAGYGGWCGFWVVIAHAAVRNS